LDYEERNTVRYSRVRMTKKEDATVVRVTTKKLKRLIKARDRIVKDEAKKQAVVDAALDHMSEYYEGKK
jgi:hypothetical protein